MKNLADIRKEYKLETLSETEAEKDPFKQFDKWWQQAINSDIDEVNAMTLSTVNHSGKPSARIVLLKGYDENGFVFFTNYESRKATDMEANPNVCLVFFWKELERQVRIEGIVEKSSNSSSDEYFFSRPQSSRIGAWASPQSKTIDSRNILDENVAKYESLFAGKDITRPIHWGGYVVKPLLFEFWQGRPSRLHDRFQYTLQEKDGWIRERLAP